MENSPIRQIQINNQVYDIGAKWENITNIPILHVEDYGAKGDGVTDDSRALQAAINDSINNNKTLFFSSGKIYCTTQPLDFIFPAENGYHSNATFDFGGATIKAIHANDSTDEPLEYIIKVDDKQGGSFETRVIFKNLRLDGNFERAHTGLFIPRTYGGVFENIKIYNTRRGVYLIQGTESVLRNIYTKRTVSWKSTVKQLNILDDNLDEQSVILNNNKEIRVIPLLNGDSSYKYYKPSGESYTRYKGAYDSEAKEYSYPFFSIEDRSDQIRLENYDNPQSEDKKTFKTIDLKKTECIGIESCTSDGFIQDCICIDYIIGIKNTGSDNKIQGCHNWNIGMDQVRTAACFYTTGQNYYTDCTCDRFRYGFYLANYQTTIHLENCLFTNATTQKTEKDINNSLIINKQDAIEYFMNYCFYIKTNYILSDNGYHIYCTNTKIHGSGRHDLYRPLSWINTSSKMINDINTVGYGLLNYMSPELKEGEQFQIIQEYLPYNFSMSKPTYLTPKGTSTEVPISFYPTNYSDVMNLNSKIYSLKKENQNTISKDRIFLTMRQQLTAGQFIIKERAGKSRQTHFAFQYKTNQTVQLKVLETIKNQETDASGNIIIPAQTDKLLTINLLDSNNKWKWVYFTAEVDQATSITLVFPKEDNQSSQEQTQPTSEQSLDTGDQDEENNPQMWEMTDSEEEMENYIEKLEGDTISDDEEDSDDSQTSTTPENSSRIIVPNGFEFECRYFIVFDLKLEDSNQTNKETAVSYFLEPEQNKTKVLSDIFDLNSTPTLPTLFEINQTILSEKNHNDKIKNEEKIGNYYNYEILPEKMLKYLKEKYSSDNLFDMQSVFLYTSPSEQIVIPVIENPPVINKNIRFISLPFKLDFKPDNQSSDELDDQLSQKKLYKVRYDFYGYPKIIDSLEESNNQITTDSGENNSQVTNNSGENDSQTIDNSTEFCSATAVISNDYINRIIDIIEIGVPQKTIENKDTGEKKTERKTLCSIQTEKNPKDSFPKLSPEISSGRRWTNPLSFNMDRGEVYIKITPPSQLEEGFEPYTLFEKEKLPSIVSFRLGTTSPGCDSPFVKSGEVIKTYPSGAIYPILLDSFDFQGELIPVSYSLTPLKN